MCEGDRIRLSNHTVRFSPEQEAAAEALLKALTAQPFSPPAASDIISKSKLKVDGKELVASLLDSGRLVQVADDIIFARSAFEEAKKKGNYIY